MLKLSGFFKGNLMKIITLQQQVLAVAAFVGFSGWTSALEWDSAILGVNRVVCRPKSDTLVSVPFMKVPLKATNKIGAFSVVAGDTATLTPAQAVSWTSGELSEKYYLRFTSGALEGRWYDITGNGASSVSIDLNGESAEGLAEGDRFVIVEYWTLDSLFPPGNQSTIYVSEGNLVHEQESKILIPNAVDAGINLAAKAVYFLTEDGWKQSAPGYPDAGDTILLPGTPFVIRHPAGVDSTKFTAYGEVLRSTDSIWLTQSSEGSQDNTVAIFRPVDVPLKESGLDDTTFEPSVSHDVRKDELLVFDNLEQGFNKKPSNSYYKVNDDWFRNDSESPATTDTLESSGGLIIRKPKGDSDAAIIWNNEPIY